MKRDSISVQLLDTPLPVDRVARRVTKKAKPEYLWQPQPKDAADKVFSKTVLPTRTPQWETMPPEMKTVIGRRRDRMTIIGYSAQQKESRNRKGASWVVRCDCGNYEHRSNILRWLSTQQPDLCIECRKRMFKLGKPLTP